jgi:hypothetical protein
MPNTTVTEPQIQQPSERTEYIPPKLEEQIDWKVITAGAGSF